MKVRPVLEYYSQIMSTETSTSLHQAELDVQSAVLGKILTDDIEIMMLNLAIKFKRNSFLIDELLETAGGTTVVVIGNPDDFDPEQMQLDEFHEEEYEDFKDGNVVSIRDFKKED